MRAHTKNDEPDEPTISPCPQAAWQEAGFRGGDQTRRATSQRTLPPEIRQPMFPPAVLKRLTESAAERDGRPAPDGTFGRTYLVWVTVCVTVLVWVTVTVRTWVTGAPGPPTCPTVPEPPDPDAPPVELPEPPLLPRCPPVFEEPAFWADFFWAALGGVPGELPPAGTRVGLKALVFVVDDPALVPVPPPEEAVPHPATSAATVSATTGAAVRRRFRRARSRRGALDAGSVSISANDTD